MNKLDDAPDILKNVYVDSINYDFKKLENYEILFKIYKTDILIKNNIFNIPIDKNSISVFKFLLYDYVSKYNDCYFSKIEYHINMYLCYKFNNFNIFSNDKFLNILTWYTNSIYDFINCYNFFFNL